MLFLRLFKIGSIFAAFHLLPLAINLKRTLNYTNRINMKLLFILTYLLTITIVANSQTFPRNHFKNDLQRQKLKGKIKSVTEKDFNSSGDSLMLKTITIYNDTGNMASFITYSPGGIILSRTAYSYNDSGKLIEEKRFKADGSLNVKTTCGYDEKGNKTEEDNYDAGGTLFLKVINRYDGKGNRIIKDSYNEFGSLFLKCNSKFDDEGHEIQAKEFDSHQSLKFTTTFEYEQDDENGNWLKRTTLKNDDPATITEREIEYRSK